MPASSPKVVLITGASSGIGAAIAREAARKGYRLALTARRADRLEALAEAARADGAEALVLPADLADPEAPGRLVASVVDRFGGLDALINNAAFGLPSFFADVEPEALRRQIEVNFTAPLMLTRFALPVLVARKGAIINIGSSITSVANPVFGAYGATKAAMAYWNDALRRELRGQGVSVSLVEPGPVDTEFFEAAAGPEPSAPVRPAMQPPPRFATARADDVARRVVRLVEHPRRRLSVLRRVVWPWRLLGGLFQVAPWLGDAAVAAALARPRDARASEVTPGSRG